MSPLSPKGRNEVPRPRTELVRVRHAEKVQPDLMQERGETRVAKKHLDEVRVARECGQDALQANA